MPYRFGSRTDVDGHVPERTIAHLTAVLHSVLPQTRDIPIAHAWCGVLAVPRDWEAGVTFDKATGLGCSGRLRRARRHRHQSGRANPGRPGAGSRHRSPSCHGSGTVRATGNPSRCAGWAFAVSTSRTRRPIGTSREAAARPRRSPSSPTGSPGRPSNPLLPSPSTAEASTRCARVLRDAVRDAGGHPRRLTRTIPAAGPRSARRPCNRHRPGRCHSASAPPG